MKRSQRAELAKETVEIVDRGAYVSAAGRAVDISAQVRSCLEATQLFEPSDLTRIRDEELAGPATTSVTRIEVVNETTLAGVGRLLADGGGPVAALNFASAKNPGGGFLGGSQAQEESLARSSALYASLLRAGNFYERHRRSPTLLYSHSMVLSPDCPVFRDDSGALLDAPQLATFITSPAPNAGAARENRPHEVAEIPDVLRERAEYVLALASSRGYKRLVLGAWGCGVFRNDPRVVAAAFMDHLRGGAWFGRFERVLFSVFDASPAQETFAAFRAAAT